MAREKPDERGSSFLLHGAGKTQRKKSIAQEDRIAKKYDGGRRVPGSGSSPRADGDVSTDEFLIEAKLTEQKGYRVTHAVLEKITREAMGAGKTPLLELEFTAPDVYAGMPRRWVLVPGPVWDRKKNLDD